MPSTVDRIDAPRLGSVIVMMMAVRVGGANETRLVAIIALLLCILAPALQTARADKDSDSARGSSTTTPQAGAVAVAMAAFERLLTQHSAELRYARLQIRKALANSVPRRQRHHDDLVRVGRVDDGEARGRIPVNEGVPAGSAKTGPRSSDTRDYPLSWSHQMCSMGRASRSNNGGASDSSIAELPGSEPSRPILIPKRPRDEPVPDEVPQLRWMPLPGSFLLAMCVQGSLTDRVLCLQNYILAATWLNRTLVVPAVNFTNHRAVKWDDHGTDPEYGLRYVADVAGSNACFRGTLSPLLTRGASKGRLPNFLMTLKEYHGMPSAEKGKRKDRSKSLPPVRVDKVICFSPGCNFPAQPLSLPPNLQLPSSFEKNAQGMGEVTTMAGFITAMRAIGEASKKSPLVSLGDLHQLHHQIRDLPPPLIAGLSTAWQGGRGKGEGQGEGEGKRGKGGRGSGSASECGALLWPHESVVEAAEGFVREVVGRRFVAVHLPRNELVSSCTDRQHDGSSGEGRRPRGSEGNITCSRPLRALRHKAECVRAKVVAASVLMSEGGGLDAADRSEEVEREDEREDARIVQRHHGKPVLFIASDASDDELWPFLEQLRRGSSNCRRGRELLPPRQAGDSSNGNNDRSKDNHGTTETPSGATSGHASVACKGDGEDDLVVVRLPPLFRRHWARALNDLHAAQDGDAREAVEQLVCAQAGVFLSAGGTAFSHRVMGMRQALGTANCMDGEVCRGVWEGPEVL